MKTILTRLSDEKAAKEVKQFTYLGLALSIVSLLILWWLAIGGLAFSARGFLLTWHKANKGKSTNYRILAAAGVMVSLVSLIWYYSQ